MKTSKKLLLSTLSIGIVLTAVTLFARKPNNNDPFKNFTNDPFSHLFEQIDNLMSHHFKQLTHAGAQHTIHKNLNPSNNNLNPNNDDDDSNSTYFIIIDDGSGQPQVQTNVPQNQRLIPPQKNQPPRQPQQPQIVNNMPPGNFFPMNGMPVNIVDPSGNPINGQTEKPAFQVYKPGEEKSKVTFADVLGQEEAIKEVYELVDFLKNPAKYNKMGAELPKGLLLEGPPGCGKTLMARAIASEAKCTFIPVSGSQFINKFVGTGADNLRKLFDQARKDAPAIIFIDEIDAIGSRERDENQEYRHTVNEILNQMDGFNKKDNVVVIAATNFKKSLDPALLRPGRFDKHVHVSLPTKQGRKDILKYYFKNKPLADSINQEELVDSLSDRTTAFSGADLKKLTNESALAACREGENITTITTKHIEEGYDRIVIGLKTNIDRSPEQLKRTAYHEAGHTVVKLLTDQPVAKVSILSRGDTLGATFNKEKYESSSEYQREELMHKLMALQGGFVAEKIFMNSSRPGVSDDLKRVNELANQMVKELGMGTGELEGITYQGMASENMKEKFDCEVFALVQQTKRQTDELLATNKLLLDKIANALMEKETLDEDEIYAVAGIERSMSTTAA